MSELVVTGAPGGVTVVTISGDVDMTSAPQVRSELVRIIASVDDPPRLVVDLCGVDLLDTVGLGALLEGVKRCALRDGRLVLARAEPQVRRELELTGMLGALPVHADVERAVADLSAG
ncbi:MAG: STAS domain-containing protein [Acidimicrobiia bacterium]|nr:STAS domain-containing protein [Acidimicrobiia bacterium]